MWTSADGTNWKRQSLPSTPGINAGVTAVAVGSSGLMAVGSTYQASTSSAVTRVWHSDDALSWTQGQFPVAEAVAERLVTLPINPRQSREALDYLIESVRSLQRR